MTTVMTRFLGPVIALVRFLIWLIVAVGFFWLLAALYDPRTAIFEDSWLGVTQEWIVRRSFLSLPCLLAIQYALIYHFKPSVMRSFKWDLIPAMAWLTFFIGTIYVSCLTIADLTT